MAIQAVLFDLDGTLLNTLEDIADSMNRALSDHKLPQHPIDAYRYFVGDGVRELAMRAAGFNAQAAPAVLKTYQAYYAAGCRDKTRPYGGVPDMLAALNRLDLPICVLSNKPHKDTLNVTAHYFPKIDFAIVRGQQEGVPVKPDPAGANSIAKYLNLSPERFLYVGDTAVDMDCARSAGMVPVGALWGFRPREELEAHQARYLIEQPGELLGLIG